MPHSLYLASSGIDFGPSDSSAFLSSLFDLALLASRSTLSTIVLSSVFSSTLWSEKMMIKCIPPRSSGSRVLWVPVSRNTERRGLIWLFVVVVAWSSLASVVSKVFALPLAMGWRVNFFLHFDIILGKNPKMISLLLLFLEIMLNGVAKGGLEMAGFLPQSTKYWGYVHHYVCLAVCNSSRRKGEPGWADPSCSLLCSWRSPFSNEYQEGFQTPCPEEVERPFLFFQKNSLSKNLFPQETSFFVSLTRFWSNAHY